MPSATQEEPVFHASKKRRRDDDGISGLDGSLHIYDGLSYRKPLFSPDGLASRQFQTPDHVARLHYVRASDAAADVSRSEELVSNPFLARKVLPAIVQPAKKFRLDDDAGCHSPGRDQRRPVAAPHSRNHQLHKIETTTTSAAATTQPARTSSALAPCHVCARRPTKKSDLDSFADCQGCRSRTCYVCMRECLGWGVNDPALGNSNRTQPSSSFRMEDAPESPVDDEAGSRDKYPVWARGGGGHRQMVCSRCCVEQGADGDVICLGCLQHR
ncbi:hypothetical protein GGTG_01599 [Gaeumannomyces tritici R3-111a-1]|uniref:Uncharacterized protein n=1 Tax=Gaeumannomyces tritici (strain R3-111a-1) TaxID=644352 RepID=J3NK17_GAET3|nr:hypothetical protein GGTG_01599 [Gaeumannomyces tritici R3-111a-1]EJT81621.1 hypothetical protein GGTG_01599 [Gaeumannomyces tritici R3-111a-1]